MQETRRQYSRRDLLLQQMGISQWQLVRPEALKGAINIAVPEPVRLIIVSEDNPVQQPITQDLLRSLALDGAQVLNITFEQLDYLQVNHAVSYWLLHKNADEIHRTLSRLQQPLNVWQSVDLAGFKADPQAKRQLWQQIQQSAPIK
ncbi:DNA polymerase III subunit psi [Aggregatibacter actinomycetemcomitans]|uniref:DNA polymerase III subunit psi n=1 Tax=Aggregatibacter actinomycetemcomitans TaxID=714 RepID=UPI00197C5052|nr:DNA polymerase III subunit psi [Aggregatibacter actinomycetemcomitans]MBN6070462.1 DNA polymerase III subunit psi [Aggregatibacter actinomycetemcomitans]